MSVFGVGSSNIRQPCSTEAVYVNIATVPVERMDLLRHDHHGQHRRMHGFDILNDTGYSLSGFAFHIQVIHEQ